MILLQKNGIIGGILGGGKYTIGKSKFEQDLRDIKLNNLLD